ncbi:hypothetical protein BN85400720 [Alteracholeplasma palmae J233]|uniref:Uncharacterized protein n=1 Tax=Alteracholeplasma palmae (strain ATCC 49389 / J233) TaxID=1318466 RepID=U4KJK0_ALTPJ|nr:hypothetical protein [Alteracholeplasma palmae]CCV63649.1 hypothetical protein BN85400720 [Alteracholeplasma palmae J233]
MIRHHYYHKTGLALVGFICPVIPLLTIGIDYESILFIPIYMLLIYIMINNLSKFFNYRIKMGIYYKKRGVEKVLLISYFISLILVSILHPSLILRNGEIQIINGTNLFWLIPLIAICIYIRYNSVQWKKNFHLQTTSFEIEENKGVYK